MKHVFILALLSLLISPASALDLSSDIDAAKQSHSDRTNKMNSKRAERVQRSQSRDRSDDVCYQLKVGSDAQIACLGDHIFAIKNDRARNIMLGNCNHFGASTSLDADLSYICNTGPKACSILNNNDAAYWCQQCDASRRWMAVYSLGRTIQCFK